MLNNLFSNIVEMSGHSSYCIQVTCYTYVQVDRDVMIWNNKTYVSKPMLVKEDQLIAKHRRWYSQFYSENSPRLSFQKENSCEW